MITGGFAILCSRPARHAARAPHQAKNSFVQDKEGNAVDMRQEYDDDDANFDNSDIGDNVLLESELQDDYSVKDADEGFDDDLGDEEPDEASLAQIEADNGDDLFDGE